MSNYKKSLWERFEDQKQEPWPFIDFAEFKGWYNKQGKMRKGSEIQVQKSHRDREVLSLISNASNEVENDSWTVEVFEDAKINFNSKTLTKFMNVTKEVLNESNS